MRLVEVGVLIGKIDAYYPLAGTDNAIDTWYFVSLSHL